MQLAFLKAWDDAVALELFTALSAEDVYKFLPAPPPKSVNDFVSRHRPDVQGTSLVYSVHLAGSEAAIGLISLRAAAPSSIDLGFMLTPSQWGNGLSRQMVKIAIDEVHVHFGYKAIVAIVDSNNAASIKTLLSNDFVETGRRETMLKWRPSVDVVMTLCKYA